MSGEGRGLLLAMTVGLASGCLGEPDTFARRGARMACKRIEACDPDLFDNEYSGDRSACRDDVENNTQFSFDALDAMRCEYRPDVARDCIETARKRAEDCSAQAQTAIDRACEGVWDCSGT